MAQTQTNQAVTADTMQDKRTLGFMDLMSVAVGQIIGSGVMVMSIVALRMTGRSVNIAFVIAAVLTMFSALPSIFVTSTIRIKGGLYTQRAVFFNETFAGWAQFVGLLGLVSISMYAVGLSSYVTQLVPVLADQKVMVAFAALTIFFILNYFGVAWMAKVQSFMFYFLIAALLAFTAFGVPQVQWGGYFGNELFGKALIENGLAGLLEASAYLTFATGGATVILSLSAEAKNPKKDMPLVIVISTLAVAVLYAFMASVIGGVLPPEQVIEAGNLGPIAFEIMPLPLYYFFMIGGACFALGTTLNSSIATAMRPMATACADGWFPEWVGKLNPKTGVPVAFLGIVYLINAPIILMGLDVGNIGKWTLIIGNVTGFITALSVMRIPKLFPEQWEKSPFHVSNGLLYLGLGATAVTLGMQAYLNLRGLEMWIVYTNIATAIVGYAWVTYRKKAGKVEMKISYELN